jgi:hypothetical protein
MSHPCRRPARVPAEHRAARPTGLLVRALVAWVLALLALLAVSPSPAAAAEAAAAQAPPTVVVFVREGCPYCAAARVYLAELAQRRPDLRIVLRPVDTDPSALAELEDTSRAAGIWPPGVPAFAVRGQVLVGFDPDGSIARQLEALLDGSPAVAEPVQLPVVGALSASRLGLPLFTLAMGMLDGFNPCATWVLVFLLSLLARLEDRRRMALVAGAFVAINGAIYFAFLAAWLNLFVAVGLTAAVRTGLAAAALVVGLIDLKDAAVPGRGLSLSIPASARPGVVLRMEQVLRAQGLAAALVAVATLALVVNLVELLCTAGLPALYTAVLAQQELSPLARHAYLALYVLGYAADGALMVGVAVWALSRRRLSARAGRLLKLLSGTVMLALAMVLFWRPAWLA